MKLQKSGYDHIYGSNYLIYIEKIGKYWYQVKMWVEVDMGLDILRLAEKDIQRQFDRKRQELGL